MRNFDFFFFFGINNNKNIKYIYVIVVHLFFFCCVVILMMSWCAVWIFAFFLIHFIQPIECQQKQFNINVSMTLSSSQNIHTQLINFPQTNFINPINLSINNINSNFSLCIQPNFPPYPHDYQQTCTNGAFYEYIHPINSTYTNVNFSLSVPPNCETYYLGFISTINQTLTIQLSGSSMFLSSFLFTHLNLILITLLSSV